MSCSDKRKVVIKLGQLNKLEDLRVIIENLEDQEVRFGYVMLVSLAAITNFTLLQLQDICRESLLVNDINTFFHYLLKGFNDTEESREKRFKVISFVLDLLNTEELNIKSTLDLITRICLDLESFSVDHVVRFVENCTESIRKQDSQTVYWKDFLPQLISVILSTQSVNVDGIPMSGVEYRSAIVKNITLINWRLSILTPISSMFK